MPDVSHKMERPRAAVLARLRSDVGTINRSRRCVAWGDSSPQRFAGRVPITRWTISAASGSGGSGADAQGDVTEGVEVVRQGDPVVPVGDVTTIIRGDDKHGT